MAVDFYLRDHIAVITLNSPELRNALSRELVTQLHQAFEQPEVQGARAVVIAAKGSAFCAGADIKDLLAAGWLEGRGLESSPVGLFRRLVSHPRPVIAAVQGLALGGGFELFLSCDLAIASVEASFAMPEIGHGVIPNTGLALLSATIGRRRALEWMLTRRRISAQEALDLGLLISIVSRDTLTESAIELAKMIVAEAAPGALAQIKASLNQHASLNWAEVDASLLRLTPAEWKEGLGAFTERRRPDYQKFWDK